MNGIGRRSASWVCGILLSLPLLSGCWDRLEIEERGTVLGVAFDPVDSMENQRADEVSGLFVKGPTPGYRISAQIAIPGRIPLGPSVGGGGTTERPIWVISSSGKTVGAAMNRLQQDLADKIFIGQMRIIIVNETIAHAYGLKDMQDYFRRNVETRRLAWLMVSRGNARVTLEASPKLERVPTLYLVSVMDHAVKLGKMPNVFLGNFWSVLSAKGRDPVLPLISVQRDRIRLDGLAMFHGPRMVGRMTPVEVAGYLELTGEKRAGYGLAVPMPGDAQHSVILRSTLRRKLVKFRMVRHKPAFDLYLNVDNYIESMPGETGRLSQRMLDKLGREATDLLYSGQAKLIRKMKRLHTDSVGFGEYVRAYCPGYWGQFKTRDEWDQAFASLPIHLHVVCRVVRSGLITD